MSVVVVQELIQIRLSLALGNKYFSWNDMHSQHLKEMKEGLD